MKQARSKARSKPIAKKKAPVEPATRGCGLYCPRGTICKNCGKVHPS